MMTAQNGKNLFSMLGDLPEPGWDGGTTLSQCPGHLMIGEEVFPKGFDCCHRIVTDYRGDVLIGDEMDSFFIQTDERGEGLSFRKNHGIEKLPQAGPCFCFCHMNLLCLM